MRRSICIACSVMAAILASAAWRTLLAQSAGGKAQSGKAVVPQACALLTPAEIAKLTGRGELANARPIRSTEEESQAGLDVIEPGGTGCGYMGSSLSVEVQRLKSIEGFQAAAMRRVKAGEFQAYRGLGDAAWVRYNKYLDQHGFVVRVGRNLLIIMMDTKEAGSAEKAKAQLLPLAQAAVTKLS